MRLFDIEAIDYKFVHTGQHYDYELYLKFIEEFKIRKPDYNIILSMKTEPSQQISEIISKVSIILQEYNPSLVLVQGDTNSVLASALAAVKCNVPVAHIEAGLRSTNWRTAEEYNRRVVDHISDVLFAPTTESAMNLKNEQVNGEIHIVGNTVIDAVDLCLQLNNNNNNGKDSNNNNIVRHIGLKRSDDFVLVTLHRSENVDNRYFLEQMLTALSRSGLNYIFPIHPRTVKRINQFSLQGLISNRIKLVKPVGYFDFLKLLKASRFIITDSGGVQEEITSPHINKHALIFRDSTERPESIHSGHAILCREPSYEKLLKAIKKIAAMRSVQNKCPYGSGDAAEKIVKILRNKENLCLKKNINTAP
jgi:UDP-N-acetylglucosamine 2-epimerase (non-hydrolysing)